MIPADAAADNRRATRVRWYLLLCFWGGDVALTVAQVYGYERGQGVHMSIAAVLLALVPGYLPWIFGIPLVFYLARRFRFERGGWRAAVPMHLAASLVIAAVIVVCCSVAVHAKRPELGPLAMETIVRFAQRQLIWSVVTYWFFLSFYLAVEAYQASHTRELKSSQLQLRASQLEAELAQAQLASLRAQLHPHFLFNALNSIGLLVEEDPEAAERMISQLSDLLRAALSGVARQVVPLEQEIALLRRYVEIERFRFEDRLRVEFEVDEEVAGAPVPTLMLQPLVENAILHGIQPTLQGGTVTISARRDGGRWLRLDVVDDGAGLPAGFERRAAGRIGLSNTRERLRTHYGDAHHFSIERERHGGTRVTVRIPWSGGESHAAATSEYAADHRR